MLNFLHEIQMPWTQVQQYERPTTEAEKQKHRQEGWCFECSKQGHIACMCSDKKTHAWALNSNPSSSNSSSIGLTTISDVASVMLGDTT